MSNNFPDPLPGGSPSIASLLARHAARYWRSLFSSFEEASLAIAHLLSPGATSIVAPGRTCLMREFPEDPGCGWAPWNDLFQRLQVNLGPPRQVQVPQLQVNPDQSVTLIGTEDVYTYSYGEAIGGPRAWRRHVLIGRSANGLEVILNEPPFTFGEMRLVCREPDGIPPDTYNPVLTHYYIARRFLTDQFGRVYDFGQWAGHAVDVIGDAGIEFRPLPLLAWSTHLPEAGLSYAIIDKVGPLRPGSPSFPPGDSGWELEVTWDFGLDLPDGLEIPVRRGLPVAIKGVGLNGRGYYDSDGNLEFESLQSLVWEFSFKAVDVTVDGDVQFKVFRRDGEDFYQEVFTRNVFQVSALGIDFEVPLEVGARYVFVIVDNRPSLSWRPYVAYMRPKVQP